MIQAKDRITQRRNCRQIVADEQNRSSLINDIANRSEAFS